MVVTTTVTITVQPTTAALVEARLTRRLLDRVPPPQAQVEKSKAKRFVTILCLESFDGIIIISSSSSFKLGTRLLILTC